MKKAIEEKMPIVGEGDDKNEPDYAGKGFPLGGKWELEEANDDVNKQDDDMILEGIRFREPTQNESDDIDGIGFQKKKIFEFKSIGHLSSCSVTSLRRCTIKFVKKISTNIIKHSMNLLCQILSSSISKV